MDKVLIEMAGRGDVWGFMAILFVGLFVAWLRFGGKRREEPNDTADEVAQMGKDVTAQIQRIDQRLSRVENDIEHLPTREEVHKMDVALAKMQSEMSGIDRVTKSSSFAIQRIENYILGVQKGISK